jgi:predicted RNase H-like HicB family nuclease
MSAGTLCYNLGTAGHREVNEMTTRTKKVTTLKFWVRIVVEKDEPGYHAYAPSLKGLHMGGDTPEEAFNAAIEAAELYLKSILKHGDAIPIDILEPGVEVNLEKVQDIISSRVVKIKVDL